MPMPNPQRSNWMPYCHVDNDRMPRITINFVVILPPSRPGNIRRWMPWKIFLERRYLILLILNVALLTSMLLFRVLGMHPCLLLVILLLYIIIFVDIRKRSKRDNEYITQMSISWIKQERGAEKNRIALIWYNPHCNTQSNITTTNKLTFNNCNNKENNHE